jgi:hypothetical protein
MTTRFETLWSQSCEDKMDEFEDAIYDKVAFKVWICLVILSIHVAIIYLAFSLAEGVPV